jgi:hypothetical protein
MPHAWNPMLEAKPARSAAAPARLMTHAEVVKSQYASVTAADACLLLCKADDPKMCQADAVPHPW